MPGELRVLMVIDSLGRGGSETSLATLAPYLPAVGVRLDVAYLHERDGVRAELEAAGAAVHPALWRGDLARSAWALGALVQELRPDLVHTTLFESDLTGRAAAVAGRVPVVTSLVNDSWSPAQRSEPGVRPWKVRTAQLLDAVTARSVVRFHALTREIARSVPPRLGVPASRVEVVRRGRDEHRLGRRTPDRRAAARRSMGLDGDGPVVLAVGRQEHQKGFDVLLEAMAALTGRWPGAVAVVAGREGNATPALRQRVAALGLDDRVRFLGERADVADLLCGADVAAFPSRREGMPGAVLEAMALEAPIVTTGTAAAREVLGDAPPALLVPVDDAAALAAALADTLAHPDAAAGRATAARRRFEDHFTIERVADGMRDFYDHALAATRWPATRR
ncbi:MAG TPA: glycosyltransferase [Acidimicrobiales bacterium]|nr:glycosyltransferase [Acidimicrobiales bacterium]